MNRKKLKKKKHLNTKFALNSNYCELEIDVQNALKDDDNNIVLPSTTNSEIDFFTNEGKAISSISPSSPVTKLDEIDLSPNQLASSYIQNEYLPSTYFKKSIKVEFETELLSFRSLKIRDFSTNLTTNTSESNNLSLNIIDNNKNGIQLNKKFVPIEKLIVFSKENQFEGFEKKFLTIYFKELRFTDHPLFTEEHKIAQKLETKCYLYIEKINEINRSDIEKEFQQICDIIKQLKRSSTTEEEDEIDYLELSKYISQARNLRNFFYKEDKLLNEEAEQICKIWNNLKDIRKKQNFITTDLKLIIRTNEDDSTAAKSSSPIKENQWIYESEGDDDDPNDDNIERDLQEIFQYSFRLPIQPKIRFNLLKEDRVSKTLSCTKEYFVKIFIDKQLLGSTRLCSLNNKFIVNLDESFGIYLYEHLSKDIRLEIYEKTKLFSKIKIADLYLPISEGKIHNNGDTKNFTLYFTSPKHKLAGYLVVLLFEEEKDMFAYNQSTNRNNSNNKTVGIIKPDKCRPAAEEENNNNTFYICNEELYSFCKIEKIFTNLRFEMLNSRYCKNIKCKDLQFIPTIDKELEDNDDTKIIELDVISIDLQKHNGKKYLIKLYNLILNQCQQLNRNQELSNLLSYNNSRTISSIVSSLLMFRKRSSLNPPKSSTPIMVPSLNTYKFNIVINLIRASGVFVRKPNKILSRQNSNESMVHQTSSFSNVRPFVLISFKNSDKTITIRSSTADGSNPTWNEQLIFQAEGNIDEIKNDIKFELFDEYIENIEINDNSREFDVHKRIHANWLGELRIPSCILFSKQPIEGIFELNKPRILLGYRVPSLGGAESSLIPIENMPEIRESIFLSLCINVEPKLSTKVITTSYLECSELKELKDYIQKWCTQGKEMVPERFVDPIVSISNGKRVCITRLIEAIPIPFENNEENDDTLIRRYVSLIPIIKSTNSSLSFTGIWLSNQIILDTTWASPKDLGVLLCCFYHRLGIQAMLILGIAFPFGETTFILLKETKGYILVDPHTGKKYLSGDIYCPLIKIFCIVSQTNMYLNIQTETRVSMTDFSVENSTSWMSLFNKNNPSPISGVHNLNYVFKTSRNVLLDLRKTIERKIMKKITSWRSKRKTIWNRGYNRILSNILNETERDCLHNNNLNLNDYVQKIEDQMPEFRVTGFTLNFSYINLATIAERTKTTGIHLNTDKNVQFSLAVKLEIYPNNIISVWIFLLSMIPN